MWNCVRCVAVCLTGSLAKCFIVVFTVHCSPRDVWTQLGPSEKSAKEMEFTLGEEKRWHGKYHLHAARREQIFKLNAGAIDRIVGMVELDAVALHNIACVSPSGMRAIYDNEERTHSLNAEQWTRGDPPNRHIS